MKTKDMESSQPWCHLLCWRPKCLKMFASVKWLVTSLSYYSLCFTLNEHYLIPILTTIEKRFGFSSSQAGMLISCKEFSILCSTVFASHLARYVHRPRLLCLTGLLAATGIFLNSSTYFLYWFQTQSVGPGNNNLFNGNYNENGTSEMDKLLCVRNNPNLSLPKRAQEDERAECKVDNKAFNQGAFVILALGYAIFGIAMSPIMATSTTYIDDCADPKKSSMYLGIIGAMKPFGILMAFVLGGLFTSLPENLKDPGYNSDDPKWIGAWWIGYLLCPTMLAVASFLIGMFPRVLPREGKGDEKASMREKTVDVIETVAENCHRKRQKAAKALDFLKSLKRILLNPVYILLTLGGCCYAYMLSGFFPFLIKYVEIQFNLSSTVANFFVGVLGTFLASLGTFLGGALVTKLKLRTIGANQLIIISSSVCTLCLVIMMLVNCKGGAQENPMAGSVGSCSSHCDCDITLQRPVCGDNGITYPSPCQAGCAGTTVNKTYTECSCIDTGIATTGECRTDYTYCLTNRLIYSALCGAVALFSLMPNVPALTIILRCVQNEDRSLMLGVTCTLAALLAFVPGPIVYGSLIDSTCLTWQKSCDVKGACLAYAPDAFRYKLHAVTVGFTTISTVIFLIVWVILKKGYFVPLNEGVEEEGEVKDTAERETMLGTISNSHNKSDIEL